MNPSIFFPEPMDQVEIICSSETAFYIIKKIAINGNVQLIDYYQGNVQVQKRHAEMYMQCEEADRSLRYISQYLKDYSSTEGQNLLPPKPSYEEYIARQVEPNLSDILQEIRDADNQLKEKINIFQNMNSQYTLRKAELSALGFFKSVIQNERMENEVTRNQESSNLELSVLEDDIVSAVIGFAPDNRIQKLITMAFRASRRNIIYRLGESNGESTPFCIFTSSLSILTKIKKICEAFSTEVFENPVDVSIIEKKEEELSVELRQMEEVFSQTGSENFHFLQDISHRYWNWKYFITQMKQIYLYLDYGDYEKIESSVIFTGWVPRRLIGQLQPLLQQAYQESGSGVPVQVHKTTAEDLLKANKELPYEDQKEIIIPTFIERNDFTYSFQLLNDSYGVPNYDELNGGAFYSMYPFLFAIMFGDIGHAFFYLLASIAILVISRKATPEGMVGSIFRFKWLLLIASICSLYCGFIYNECFGLPISMSKTSYEPHVTASGMIQWNMTSPNVYPFGIDHTWLFKDNELIFLNSYKMKLSIVMGMCQMIFGMVLQLINHIHRKDVASIFIEWLPKILYLIPFFGYLVVLIIKKWCTHFQGNNDFSEDIQNNGINLIQMMISMILNLGSKDQTLQLYKEQWDIQLVIVIIFFISIPYLLFAKPIYDCIKLRGTPNFSVLEIFVMNLIGVIEFCLGALSHTASYLRLWALSLAHSQLSHVVYEELLIIEINAGNFFFIFIGFAGFAALSVAILLGMEAFSALLHAIRLMWVEFSSKFYEGMGVAFRPISLRKDLSKVDQ
ncbi:V-type ATPase subunit family protein [Histomonas meleagridis]|uniref:V-type ATPase subunit family protein n=1 Tax=Histomonas meleagridis TaxID=135588 RepID=UPI0035594ADF|nr:V-type ATPase subunit family protein [Histomonas meleagridis]KAH0799280.1 V-type ATPase subunit family protein [Histomonas meleagridis]